MTLLHIGKRVCSSEQMFQEEVKWIKQFLMDNNFLSTSVYQNTTETQVIELYYHNQMTSNVRVEERKKKDLVSKHLAPVSHDSVIPI